MRGTSGNVADVIRSHGHAPTDDVRQLWRRLVLNWRQTALGPKVGMQARELEDFAPAFEHKQMDVTAALLRR